MTDTKQKLATEPVAAAKPETEPTTAINESRSDRLARLKAVLNDKTAKTGDERLARLSTYMSAVREPLADLKTELTNRYAALSKTAAVDCPLQFWFGGFDKPPVPTEPATGLFLGVCYESKNAFAAQLAVDYASNPSVKFEIDNGPNIDSSINRCIVGYTKTDTDETDGTTVQKQSEESRSDRLSRLEAAFRSADKTVSMDDRISRFSAYMTAVREPLTDMKTELIERYAALSKTAGCPLRFRYGGFDKPSIADQVGLFLEVGYDAKNDVATQLASTYAGHAFVKFKIESASVHRSTLMPNTANAAPKVDDETAIVERREAARKAFLAPLRKKLEIVKKQIAQRYSERSPDDGRKLDFGYRLTDTYLHVYYKTDDVVGKLLAADYADEDLVRFEVDDRLAD